MAKDKGGHGSEKRGVSGVQARNDRMFAMFDRAPGLKAAAMSVPDQHQHRIAVQTLKMPDAMANVMGGPNKAQAEATLREKFGYGDRQIANLQGNPVRSSGGQPVASNAHAAATLAGGPKSAAVETHPAHEEYAKSLEASYRAQHGWSGDVGKHNGG